MCLFVLFVKFTSGTITNGLIHITITSKGGVNMKNEYILRTDILKLLDLKKNKWSALKGKEYDVTHENFIDDVLLVLDWVMDDIANYKCTL